MLSSAEAEAAVDTLNETTSNTAGPPPDAAAASFPEPYNTTGDTVTRGAFAALVDPYKRSIGIDPSEPPGNVFLYVSRFVSSANRRVVREVKVARALRAVAQRNGFEFTIWNKTTGDLRSDAKVWARARVVAGLHGGGLTNAGFLHPHATVVEATPPPSGCVRFCFAAVAFSLGVAWHAFTPADTAGFTCQDYRNHRPIALDPHAFAAYVGTVLNATRRREGGGGGYDESASET